MKDYILYRKITRIVMQLAEELQVTPKRALLLFYSTTTAAQLQDPKYGLQLMSDTYLVNDIKNELSGLRI
ncbi:MAG: DUF3791 domain-containing protein [Paludibacteraceae bacterium]|nr:DUF3791 domain-containing protein [Candidatus Colousia faecequi]MCQ2337769.1 DUF3791 domain-containing protein [Paludibacteraceae bacterium]